MVRAMEWVERNEHRRCSCDAVQELRWETPQRRMYSCAECGVWSEESKAGVMDELVETEETFQDTL